MCTPSAEDRLMVERYYLLGVFGSALALFGLLANGLLATLFLTRAHYRHSPFFFLGFVALFDTLLDATFILILSVPVSAEYFDTYGLFLICLNYMPILYLFGQIFKISSVFCLIMASIERRGALVMTMYFDDVAVRTKCESDDIPTIFLYIHKFVVAPPTDNCFLEKNDVSPMLKV
uniref:G_PROTEIN_RECEP_F1_2 domain-containing protein n=1 Tax=Heterorhabditis bacteriophora TaxID=37862 RepID=A0A1I7X7R2_HETBA